MREVRVIGAPRSGTNVARYLIEANADVKCFFNHGWWKHAIIPPLMSQRQMINDKIPTIIMFREPVRQIVSFYKFARKGRTAMSGADDFRTFISSPVRMTPDRSIEYQFSSPIEYWNQFYYAALSWKTGKKLFIALEDLQENPRMIAAVLAKFFPETRYVVNQLIPDEYFGRNPDRHFSEGWEYETDTTLDRENQQADLLRSSLSPAEVAAILSTHTTALYECLRAKRFSIAIDTRSAAIDANSATPPRVFEGNRRPKAPVVRICFVCQSGTLEPQAILLAASLRLHFPKEIGLIAAHPTTAGRLRPETEEALAALDVITVPICNSLREDYFIGNKLAALSLLNGQGFGIFLDTDMLAMAPPKSLSDALSAVPASFNHHARPVWQHAYEKFGLALPVSAPPTLVSHDQTAPYYNSGMIAIPGPLAGSLARAWIDTAAQIDNDPVVPPTSKQRFLDQLSLPIAATRLGIQIEAIDPRWNFPGWAWRIEDRGTPILFHYQTLERLKEEELSVRAAEQAADILPSVRRALAAFAYVG